MLFFDPTSLERGDIAGRDAMLTDVRRLLEGLQAPADLTVYVITRAPARRVVTERFRRDKMPGAAERARKQLLGVLDRTGRVLRQEWDAAHDAVRRTQSTSCLLASLDDLHDHVDGMPPGRGRRLGVILVSDLVEECGNPARTLSDPEEAALLEDLRLPRGRVDHVWVLQSEHPRPERRSLTERKALARRWMQRFAAIGIESGRVSITRHGPRSLFW